MSGLAGVIVNIIFLIYFPFLNERVKEGNCIEPTTEHWEYCWIDSVFSLVTTLSGSWFYMKFRFFGSLKCIITKDHSPNMKTQSASLIQN